MNAWLFPFDGDLPSAATAPTVDHVGNQEVLRMIFTLAAEASLSRSTLVAQVRHSDRDNASQRLEFEPKLERVELLVLVDADSPLSPRACRLRATT